MDGANAWQRLVRITIPLMRNTFLFSFVVDGISTLKMYGIPNVLGGVRLPTAPVGMAPILNILMEAVYGGRFGRASAAGWLLFVVILVVSRMQFALLSDKRKGG